MQYENDNIIYFDTETTGLPENEYVNGRKQMVSPLDKWETYPHIVQMSWVFNGTENDFIIMPDGWSIPAEVAEIHGISQEKARNEGMPWVAVMVRFLKDLQKCSAICAHNINFDIRLVIANTIRSFGQKFYDDNVAPFIGKDRQIDTMIKTIDFVAIPGKFGRYKWPTLTELHTKLFGEAFHAHNSMDDVRAMVRCYVELKKIGVL